MGGVDDPAAVVEALVVAHYGSLVRAMVLSGVDVEVAEEAAQEAFTRLWRTVCGGGDIRRPAAWLSTVAFNEVRSRWRRRRVEQRMLPAVAPLPVPAVDLVEGEAVRAALAGLPRRQREAVVCFYFLDLSVTDTAAVMGASEGMVKNALSRARARLAAVLGVSGEEVEVDGDSR